MVGNDQANEGLKEILSGRFKNFVTKAWSIRFVRFLVVSGINTLFGYTIYSIFILLHTHYAIASLLSTICGVIFNFFTTGRIVFRNNNSSLIFKFFLVYGITYLFNLLALSRFNAAGFNMLAAGAIMILPSAILSYFLNKKLVFQETRAASELKGDRQFGFIITTISIAIALVYLILIHIFWNRFMAGTAPILLSSLVLGGVSLFFVSRLGEFTLNINTRVINRPLVIEEKRLGFDK